MGPKTHRGILRYQQRQGLAQTGQLDTVTLQRLTAAANTNSGSSAPAQPQ
jgi:peptidoglycan hydrolase-like protein with peptidoglycan-binding domain